MRLPVMPIATVGVVLAASGYPDAPRPGDEIAGLDRATASGALVFHGGTAGQAGTAGKAGAADTADGAYRTAGGRVLTVIGRGPDVAAARAQAEAAADLITFDGLQRRRDIGAVAVPVGAAP
jgi:phosphoribosylamine--glycine ligase